MAEPSKRGRSSPKRRKTRGRGVGPPSKKVDVYTYSFLIDRLAIRRRDPWNPSELLRTKDSLGRTRTASRPNAVRFLRLVALHEYQKGPHLSLRQHEDEIGVAWRSRLRMRNELRSDGWVRTWWDGHREGGDPKRSTWWHPEIPAWIPRHEVERARREAEAYLAARDRGEGVGVRVPVTGVLESNKQQTTKENQATNQNDTALKNTPTEPADRNATTTTTTIPDYWEIVSSSAFYPCTSRDGYSPDFPRKGYHGLIPTDSLVLAVIAKFTTITSTDTWTVSDLLDHTGLSPGQIRGSLRRLGRNFLIQRLSTRTYAWAEGDVSMWLGFIGRAEPIERARKRKCRRIDADRVAFWGSEIRKSIHSFLVKKQITEMGYDVPAELVDMKSMDEEMADRIAPTVWYSSAE